MYLNRSLSSACAAGLALWLTGTAWHSPAQDAVKAEPGLIMTCTSGTTVDLQVSDGPALYVPAGQPATPFVAPGKFTTTWDGFINVDLRDSYVFVAELNGSLKLEINSNVVFEAASEGKATEPSKRVRLGKGANTFKLTYNSPDKGDAFIRFFWTPPELGPEPIPTSSLTHAVGSAELAKSMQLRRGRELFVELRCAKCHKSEDATLPDLAMDAPSFEGIGSRRHAGWMTGWILDPHKQRASSHMPKLLHGASAQEDASAIASFLASLQGDAGGIAAKPDLAQAGKSLAEKLHCVACHNLPGAKEQDAKKVSLEHVNFKFPPDALVAFLKSPGAHYAWTRMPDFKLKDDEAQKLAAFLSSGAPMAKQVAASTDAAVIAKGKQLVQNSGCLNCHSLKLDNMSNATSLASLAGAKWNAGCLADSASGKSPEYALTAEDRAALRAFGSSDRASLKRPVPADFAQRFTKSMNCTECHGKFEGFPPFQVLGGKLKPEWTQAFIAGEVKYKPRTWLESRMPVFPKYAEGLAQGLAMLNGLPPKTPAEPPINEEAAKAGHAMISTDGGFSCIACHAVRNFGATQVFEAAGINLGWSAERLQPSFYTRWVNNPLRIDPQTKMPVYFSQGQSPLSDYFNGDAKQQIDALWQYIRQGDKMPLPKEAGGGK